MNLWLVTRYQIMMKGAIDDERLEIAESGPPGIETLKEIVDQLAEMKCGVIANGNAAKISEFVKSIDEWESRNGDIPD
jgi:hypothetical protein